MAKPTEQPFVGLLLLRLCIHEERNPPARRVVDERHQSQLGQRLHLSVQINVGVYLFYLCLRQKRQLQKVLYSCRVDVQGMFRELLQLLQMLLKVLFLCPLHIARVLLHEVVPIILLRS